MVRAAACESERQQSGRFARLRLESHSGALRESGRTCHNGQSVTEQVATYSRQFMPASAAPQSRHFASIAPRSEAQLIAAPPRW